VKADRRHPLVPRGSKRFGKLYAGRAAVEREFGRLKNERALTPLRVRGRERVALHADLTMLARLSLGSRPSAGRSTRGVAFRSCKPRDVQSGLSGYSPETVESLARSAGLP
jgi:hypothetical protein